MTKTHFIAALGLTVLMVLAPDKAVPAMTKTAAASHDPATLEQASIANQNAQAAYYRSQLAPPAKRELPLWFNAVLPLVALVVGSFLTYAVAARQASETQSRLYRGQKAQVRAATHDLANTLEGLRLSNNEPLNFLQERFLIEQPERPHVFSRNDPYYQKYDFVNLVYRLCAVLGWMELHRIDPTFLNGSTREKQKIESSFREIRLALSADFAEEKAKPPLPGIKEGSTWADGIILEDDQRAIGEVMLIAATKDSPPSVLGYGDFCVSLFRFAKRDNDIIRFGDQNFWIWNATRFIVDVGGVPPETDFRRRRLTKVLSELRTVNTVLDGEETNTE